MLNVHRNDCCELGTTTATIVTDRCTTIFEMFPPFKCLTVLCLKSSVDICRFYTFFYKKHHHHMLS
ncbi:unnamed protein product, partial [Staurois parvus]